MHTEIGKCLGSLPKTEASFIEPMECLSVSKLPEGLEWLWEFLCGPPHKISWTKPLRGRWWCGSRAGLTDHPQHCFLVRSRKSLCESMERLLTAANSISQRSIHDLSTTPHDRGHANPQLSSEYPKGLRPTGVPIRAVLPEVARTVGT